MPSKEAGYKVVGNVHSPSLQLNCSIDTYTSSWYTPNTFDGTMVLFFTGLDSMRKFRSENRKQTSKILKDHELSNGPSKLCTAMDINKDNCNNIDLVTSVEFWVEDTLALETFTVVHTTRIGIQSYGEESALKPYRYYVLGNKNVSIRDRSAENKLSC